MIYPNSQTGEWRNVIDINSVSYVCGYCGAIAAPSFGYNCLTRDNKIRARLYICPACNKPTYISFDKNEQTPGPILGKNVLYVPELTEVLYNEARKCITVGAHTSAVLACRKILMNVAVQEGATEGLQFIQYINYLEKNGFLPPKGRQWVDQIRKKGNDATHEIPPISLEDATQILTFTEMLLRFVYEFAGPPAE